MNKKILIVPDVHGRDFWKAVLPYTDVPVIFLGDYVAPYTKYEPITDEQAIEMFKEILDFRRENPDRVTLLLGNHDCSYSIGIRMCDNRVDNRHYETIRKLFWDKKNAFQLTDSILINGKQFIFSHAGYTTQWVRDARELFMRDDIDKVLEDWDYLNRMNKSHSNLLYTYLQDRSITYRGGSSDYGSPIWADFQEHIKENVKLLTDKIQIFGHSWCKVPIHDKAEYEWYMLDCKEVFYIDDQGVVRYLKDDKEIPYLSELKKDMTN